jgi:hypothetical protein
MILYMNYSLELDPPLTQRHTEPKGGEEGNQVFSNPQIIFNILSLTVAVTGAIAAYIYFRKSRKYKELSYEILPTLSLVRVGPQVRDRVEITYKHGEEETENIPIESLEAVAVRIHNTGTEAVKFTNDSSEGIGPEMPVTLDFGQEARLLGEPSAETTPKGRNVVVRPHTKDPGKVIMEEFLLNPKESVTISTFLTNFPLNKPLVDWHIEGVAEPRELKRDRRSNTVAYVIGGLMAGLIAVIATFSYLIYVALQTVVRGGPLPGWLSSSKVSTVVVILVIMSLVLLIQRLITTRPTRRRGPPY